MVGDVTANQSMTYQGGVEPGCRVFAVDSSVGQVRKLFDALQRRHPELQCAHVRAVHNEKEGCIYNVCHAYEHNKCPQYTRRCGVTNLEAKDGAK